MARHPHDTYSHLGHRYPAKHKNPDINQTFPGQHLESGPQWHACTCSRRLPFMQILLLVYVLSVCVGGLPADTSFPPSPGPPTSPPPCMHWPLQTAPSSILADPTPLLLQPIYSPCMRMLNYRSLSPSSLPWPSRPTPFAHRHCGPTLPATCRTSTHLQQCHAQLPRWVMSHLRAGEARHQEPTFLTLTLATASPPRHQETSLLRHSTLRVGQSNCFYHCPHHHFTLTQGSTGYCSTSYGPAWNLPGHECFISLKVMNQDCP